LGPTVFTGQFPLTARRPKVIEAWEQPSRPAREDAIPVGARVFHQKFGCGNVVGVEGNKLTIQFDKAGEKRVVDSFVDPV
jgi:DNA helicase-2/ATP-dependent DNA helicase PcrA